MHVLKSAILAIFHKLADWLDWPCPASAALQNGSQEFFLFYILIVRSSASSFGHSDSDPSSVISSTKNLDQKWLRTLPI